MSVRRALVATTSALACAMAGGCGPKPIEQPKPPPSARVLIVLLPDADSGRVGRVHVSNAAGLADLSSARASTEVTVNGAPGPVSTMSEAEVESVFGAALSALPAIPRRFTLNFRFQSEELTEGSRAVVPEILKAVKEYTAPEVVVIGHTDTVGAAPANVELGMKRAGTVRAILVKAGLDPATIEVRSHGEGDLLIQTPDSTREPRNRRVEIAVR
jgi:outer membrane protein OmpA-like peptidoglycan-associated protein